MSGISRADGDLPGRAAEVRAKLDRVRDWLHGSGYGGALFTTQPGVAWVTGGLEDRVVRNEEPALVWALVTEAARRGYYLPRRIRRRVVGVG